jgi:hypothetical protein
MSLTNINLPGFVIADLYRNSLIQPERGVLNQREAAPPVDESQPVTKAPVAEIITAAKQVQQSEPVAYKFLGNNKQQISVVVNCPNDVFVPEADLQFLTKMLGACKLNMADVAIVNYASAPIAIDKLKTQLQPRSLLLFGVEPGDIQLPINFPPFKEQPYAGTTYLYTPSLSQLNQETEEAKLLKRKLWDCLKRMFL